MKQVQKRLPLRKTLKPIQVSFQTMKIHCMDLVIVRQLAQILTRGVCVILLLQTHLNTSFCICRRCKIGKFIARKYVVDIGQDVALFTGVVLGYDQKSKTFEVRYHSDGVKETYKAAELQAYLDLFEHWYGKVSRGGQRFTRKQSLCIVVKAFRREQLQNNAKKCAVSSAASSAGAAATTNKVDKDILSARISVMKVGQLRAELGKHTLNTSGNKAELVVRLCAHHKCPLPKKKKEKEPAKHAAKWRRKVTKKNKKAPFKDGAFNDASLRENLPGFPDRAPEPWECYDFFFTEDMWKLGHHTFHAFPKYTAAQEARPPWTPKNQPWPPVWVQKPLDLTLELYKFMTVILYMMGLKRLGRNNLRSMFSNDELLQEQWLKRLTTRKRFEAFLRQLHFEDSGDPFGKKFPHSTNYRPNGVPKVTNMHACIHSLTHSLTH